MDDDDLLLLIAIGGLAYVAYAYLGLGVSSGDGGDETAPQSTDGGGMTLDASDIYALAQSTLDGMGIADITPGMATTIAMIESSGDPGAVRQEPRIGDASYGLMQVLTKTAVWLHDDLGYAAFDATPAVLTTAEGGVYFGCAFLHWLRNYQGAEQSDAWVVAAYNGGPGGVNGAGPQNYLAAYEARASSLGYV